MAKPVPRRVPSDDCDVSYGGEVCYPHEGEWVEVLAGVSARDLKAFRGLAELRTQLLANQPDADADADAVVEAQMRDAVMVDGTYDHLVAVVQAHLIAWNWTDARGRPYPQLDADPEVVRRLDLEEIIYLLQVIKGEGPGERKNELRPLPTTSSASARPRSRVS